MLAVARFRRFDTLAALCTQTLGSVEDVCLFFLHDISRSLEKQIQSSKNGAVQELTLVHTGAHSLQLLCTITLQSEREGVFQSLALNRVPVLQEMLL